MKTFDHHGGLGPRVWILEHPRQVVMALHHLRHHRPPPYHVVMHHSLQRYSICTMVFYQTNLTNLGAI